ncbi:MAG: DUF2807 domain-containing protein [Actinobacteria bacterium]|nr:DUF2807 domain-containing protein [Actinomycetota bacterium]MBM3710581.1 DUF2807 domain-containing protein [Actinomycetota bacterium]
MSKLVKEKRDIKNFTNLIIRCIANLEISQSDEESVMIEALPSSINKIKTEIDNEKLTVGYTWLGYLWPRKINLYIKLKKLKGIYAYGAADIKSEGIKTDKIKLQISGAGKIVMALESKEMVARIYGAGTLLLTGYTDQESVRINGAGDLNAEGFKAREASIIITGAGSAKVDAEQALDIRISGAGEVYYKGNPQINQHISGAGKVYKI